MDLRLSSAQQLLAHSARSLLAQRCPPERSQEWASDPRGLPAELWKEMAALGWTGLMIPPELGGSGGSVLDVIALVEEMGHAALPSPYVPSAVVSTRILLDADPRPHTRELLSRLALGERICTVAALEENGRLDDVAMRVEAGRLHGQKLFVSYAHVATDLIVIGRGRNGDTAALLPIDRPGVRVVSLDSMGSDRLFQVDFEAVEVENDDLLAPATAHSTLIGPAFALGGGEAITHRVHRR